MTDAIDLTIVMPCLNEAETLGACIEKAQLGIERSGVRGNGSILELFSSRWVEGLGCCL